MIVVGTWAVGERDTPPSTHTLPFTRPTTATIPDLVGLGFSDKPALFSSDRRYGIELWGKLVEDFVTDRLGSKAGAPVYLCGNSFGSLVALQAAAREGEGALNVKGICMVNW